MGDIRRSPSPVQSIAINKTFVEILVSKICPLLSITDHQRLRSVCKSWKEALDNAFGLTFHFNNANWNNMIDLRNTAKVSHAIFTNWSKEYKLLSTRTMAAGLQTLEIQSPTQPLKYRSMMPLLVQCENLKTLIIRNIITVDTTRFKKCDMQAWKKSSPFPHLETFKLIDDWPRRQRDPETGAFDTKDNELKAKFLSHIFEAMKNSKLKRIEVKLKNSGLWLPLNIIFAHNEFSAGFHLEKSLCSISKLIPIQTESLGREGLDRLREVIIKTDKVISLQFYKSNLNHAQRNIKQLESFSKILGYPNRDAMPRYDYLRKAMLHHLSNALLTSQNNLKNLTFDIDLDDHYEPEKSEKLNQILKDNVKTLEKLSLICTMEPIIRDYLWDAKDFNGFHALRELSLIDLSFTLPPLSVLTNISYLPQGLTQLKLHCPLKVKFRTLNYCFRNLVNLERFELVAARPKTPWFIMNDEPKYVVGLYELKDIILGLPKLTLFDIFWPMMNGISLPLFSSCVAYLNIPKIVNDKLGIRELTFNLRKCVRYDCGRVNRQWELKRTRVTIRYPDQIFK